MFKGILNSLIVSTCSAALCTYFSALTAYGLYAYNFKFKKLAFTFIMAILVMPTQVTAMGFLRLMTNMGLYDTLWPLILPSFLGGGAFNIFLLRQFFLGIPTELDEAARIDGANAMQIFFKIILPLSRSAMIVVGLFTFLNNWNDFFGPIIYLNSKEHYTLALGLLQLKGDYSTKWNLLMAGSTIVAAPCILLYLVGQKYLIEGISMTGLKA